MLSLEFEQDVALCAPMYEARAHSKCMTMNGEAACAFLKASTTPQSACLR